MISKKPLVFAVLFITVFLIMNLPAGATEEPAPESGQEVVATNPGSSTAGTANPAPFDNLAVVLVIDVSGSMSYTDPLRLRETAAGMFIDLLGADDYLGVVIFDDRAEVVSPLAPVGGPAVREDLMRELSTRLNPRGDTDFIEALDLARRQFAETDIGGRVPVILLMTDGEPDPYPRSREDEVFMAGYMEEMWEKVDLLAGDDVLIYTVGFSEEIDPEVIQEIAVNTRGQYYILQEPVELLLAFYQALEALKDRRGFLSEEVDLGEGSSHTFSFELDEFTRQLNLVFLGDTAAGEAGFDVEVRPPRGRAENIDELLIGGRDNYLAVMISRPREEHYGTWEVDVTGSGKILALGNTDLYLEALLIDPDPSANYPLYEQMNLVVEVITRERYAGEVFEMEMQVTGPGDPAPIDIALLREGNLYRGSYDYADRPGNYLLEWSVLRDGEAVLKNSATVKVSNLPAITSDLWVSGEGMRLGERLLVSASLTSGGERLQQGPHLEVDAFELKMEYRDGARIEYTLFDSGSSEHGNSRSGDGIWSNYLVFDREGSARVLLTATGKYRDDNFILKKSFGLTVAAPGDLAVSLLPGEQWGQAGDRIVLPLQVQSNSPFTQTLRLESGSALITVLNDRLVVPPEELLNSAVEIRLDEEMLPGEHNFTLGFWVEDGMTVVAPEELTFKVEILTAREVFMQRFSGLGTGAVTGLVSLLIFAGFFYGGGLMLNRFYLAPRLKMSGYLAFREEGEKPDLHRDEDRKFNLARPRKRVVTVAVGQEKLRSDFIVPAEGSGYKMVLSNRWNDHLPGFLRGWKALFSRALALETLLKCTPPGVIVSDGKISTSKELHSGDQFETGGYIFTYSREEEKGLKSKDRGKNILDGKM